MEQCANVSLAGRGKLDAHNQAFSNGTYLYSVPLEMGMTPGNRNI